MRPDLVLSHPQRPLDRFVVHRQKVLVVPQGFAVPDRGHEHLGFAVHLRPGHRIVPVRSRVVGNGRELGQILAQQHVDVVAGVLIRVVDRAIGQVPHLRQMPGERRIGTFVDEGG